jgi:polysaccharide biosynthesis protein VpsM
MPRSLPLWDSFGQYRVAASAWLKGQRSTEFGPDKRRRGQWLQVWDQIVTYGFAFSLTPDLADLDRHVSTGTAIKLPDRRGNRTKPRRKPSLVNRLILPVACTLFPGQAFAQVTEPAPLTPVDQFLPENSQGIRIAPAIVLQSHVDATIEYDTNIYNRELNPRSDTIVVVRPTLHLGTDWSRHAIELEGSAQVQRFFRTSSENSEQWNLKSLATYDLGERLTFNAGAGLARKIEPRGSVGDIFGTDRPIRLMEKYATFKIARTGGRLELIVDGTITKFTFADASLNGVPIDLGFRDVIVRQAHVRTNFALGPRIGLFAELSGNQIDYTRDIGTPRNSSGFGLLGGIHYQVSALVDVEAAVGLISQSYDDPLVPKTQGLNFSLAVSWTPTSRWKLTAAGHRTVAPSPAIGVSAIVRSDFNFTAQYAVSDKVLVEAGGAYVNEDYRGFVRGDKQVLANVAVHYRLNDHLMVSAKAGYRQRSSSVPGEGYNGWNFGLALRAAL